MEASSPATPATDFDPHWEQGGGIDASGRRSGRAGMKGETERSGGAGPGERERRFEAGENAGEPGVKWAEARGKRGPKDRHERTAASAPCVEAACCDQPDCRRSARFSLVYKGTVGSRGVSGFFGWFSSGCRPCFERGGRYCLCCIWKTEPREKRPGK